MLVSKELNAAFWALRVAFGFGSLIAPQAATWLAFGWLPIGLAEILAGLWLLIKGVETPATLG